MTFGHAYFRKTDGADTLIARPLDTAILLEIGREGILGEFQMIGAVRLEASAVQHLIDALRHARRLLRQREGYHRRGAATVDARRRG